MNIFLIGFMGSGKTTLGKKIASRMGYRFVDMDKALEEEQQLTVPQLFALDGEEKFRALETAWLEHFAGEKTVVATGGGAPCFHNNLSLMKKKGTTIYLRSPAANLAKRLYNSPASRPLIDHVRHNLDELTSFVNLKLAEREPVYNQCHLVFDSFNADAAKLDQLIERIKQNG